MLAKIPTEELSQVFHYVENIAEKMVKVHLNLEGNITFQQGIEKKTFNLYLQL